MTPTPQAIENAARAMRHITFNALTMDECRDAAQAALSADLGDMVLVPKEPTGAMCEVARSFDEAAGGKSYEYRDLYRAMIAAAEDLNWSPPFKAGDRVMHTGRSENGTVTAIEDGCVVVEFDSPTPRGNKSIGRYDETWFRQYPRGLIAAAEDSNDQG